MVPSIAIMPREGSLALAVFGRVRKLQESPRVLSAGRRSFALKRILEAVLVISVGITDTNLLFGRCAVHSLNGVIASLRIVAQTRDQKKHNPDHSGIPAKHGTQQTVTSSGSDEIADTTPKIQMRPDNSEKAMVVSNACKQD